jgi:hypothetical protein
MSGDYFKREPGSSDWEEACKLLRRAADFKVGFANIQARYSDSEDKDWPPPLGNFIEFDATTGWPKFPKSDCSQTAAGGTTGDCCKICETEMRGITPRQLIATYEAVKLCCKSEGWTSPFNGTPLTPETVTLYDLAHYVIKPATETSKCSFVEFITSLGEKSGVGRCPSKHVPMAKTKVYQQTSEIDWSPVTHNHAYYTKARPEEIECTNCKKKLKLGETYWVCHRCGDKLKLCDACATGPESVCNVSYAELQKPLWFVSHWYARCRGLSRS